MEKRIKDNIFPIFSHIFIDNLNKKLKFIDHINFLTGSLTGYFL